jgi:hypothetical protein
MDVTYDQRGHIAIQSILHAIVIKRTVIHGDYIAKGFGISGESTLALPQVLHFPTVQASQLLNAGL